MHLPLQVCVSSSEDTASRLGTLGRKRSQIAEGRSQRCSCNCLGAGRPSARASNQGPCPQRGELPFYEGRRRDDDQGLLRNLVVGIADRMALRSTTTKNTASGFAIQDYSGYASTSNKK